MITINIITVGTLKEKYLREACGEYLKRLQAFCNVKVIELSEARLPDKPSKKEIDAALSAEARAMQPYLSVKNAINVAMCIEGEQRTSPQLGEMLTKAGVDGFSTVNFVIGSSFGIAEEIKTSARVRLSMSKMTFPHQLARVMLLEQLYRGFSIASNGKYHK